MGGQRSRDSSVLLEGGAFGRYRLIANLSRRGLGKQWLARLNGPHGLSRLVVIKALRAEQSKEPYFRDRFLAEVKIGSGLHHAHVVSVLDAGEQDGSLYCVLPFVEGVSLGDFVRSQAHALADAYYSHYLGAIIRIMADALAGLDAVHDACDEHGGSLQLVHRKVMPDSILVGIDGVARLGELGIARRGNATETEAIEAGSVDARSDLFSAGIVLWEALTRKPLFDDKTPRGPGGRLPSPQQIEPRVPDAIGDVVMRALQPRPRDRFRYAGEMIDQLYEAAVASRIDPFPRNVERLIRLSCRTPLDRLSALARGARASSWSDSVTQPGNGARVVFVADQTEETLQLSAPAGIDLHDTVERPKITTVLPRRRSRND